MKAITTVATALAVLAIPSSALAQPTGTACSTQGGGCFTIAPTDHYAVAEEPTAGTALLNTSSGAVTMQGNGGCVYVYRSKAEWQNAGSPSGSTTCVMVPVTARSHSFDRYLFNVPGQDYAARSPFQPTDQLIVIEYVAEGKVASTRAYTTLSTPTQIKGSQLNRYCDYYRQINGDGTPTRYAQDATPQDVYDACVSQLKYFDGRWSEREQTPTPPKPETVKPAGPVVVPGSAAKCGKVGKVDVRSSRVRCASARTVIARYARTLKSPAGWSCVATVTDAGRRARCVKKAGKGRAVTRTAVYGIWRPR